MEIDKNHLNTKKNTNNRSFWKVEFQRTQVKYFYILLFHIVTATKIFKVIWYQHLGDQVFKNLLPTFR